MRGGSHEGASWYICPLCEFIEDEMQRRVGPNSGTHCEELQCTDRETLHSLHSAEGGVVFLKKSRSWGEIC